MMGTEYFLKFTVKWLDYVPICFDFMLSLLRERERGGVHGERQGREKWEREREWGRVEEGREGEGGKRGEKRSGGDIDRWSGERDRESGEMEREK